MRVPNLPDRSGERTISQTYFDRQWFYLAQAINGGLTVGSPHANQKEAALRPNLQVSWYEVETPAAPGVNFKVPHTLGRIPSGYIVVRLDRPAIIYEGSLPWTRSTLTLRSSIASTRVTLLII